MTQVANRPTLVSETRMKRARFTQAFAPYGFVTPVTALIMVLMVIPIAIVIGYSTLDNVIMTPESEFVGLQNYVKIL